MLSKVSCFLPRGLLNNVDVANQVSNCVRNTANDTHFVCVCVGIRFPSQIERKSFVCVCGVCASVRSIYMAGGGDGKRRARGRWLRFFCCFLAAVLVAAVEPSLLLLRRRPCGGRALLCCLDRISGLFSFLSVVCRGGFWTRIKPETQRIWEKTKQTQRLCLLFVAALLLWIMPEKFYNQVKYQKFFSNFSSRRLSFPKKEKVSRQLRQLFRDSVSFFSSPPFFFRFSLLLVVF